jgi:hypothetical protein
MYFESILSCSEEGCFDNQAFYDTVEESADKLWLHCNELAGKVRNYGNKSESMIWLLPNPLSGQQLSPVSLTVWRRLSSLTGEGGGGGGGAKSYDGEKAWSSINPLILSGKDEMRCKADIRKHVHKEQKMQVRTIF